MFFKGKKILFILSIWLYICRIGRFGGYIIIKVFDIRNGVEIFYICN